jgi:hypothetical protein
MTMQPVAQRQSDVTFWVPYGLNFRSAVRFKGTVYKKPHAERTALRELSGGHNQQLADVKINVVFFDIKSRWVYIFNSIYIHSPSSLMHKQYQIYTNK